jgi:hypothetical protein
MGDEAIVATSNGLVVLHEANLPKIEPSEAIGPHGRLLNPSALDLPPEPVQIDPFAFRVTDATRTDQNGEFWVLNYFWHGERDTDLLPKTQDSWEAVAACSGDYSKKPLPNWLPVGTDRTITKGDWSLEQITKLVYQEGKISCLGKRTVLEAYVQGGRNWEGLVRLDDAGWLLAADMHTNVAFAFTPSRSIYSTDFGNDEACFANSRAQ